MEFQRFIVMLHLFLAIVIHTQIAAVGSLNQASLPSVDLKRHHLTVETTSLPADFTRRQLAGGGGGGGGGSRGGSSGGGSSGGGSKGGGGSGTGRGGSSNRGGSGGGGGGGGSRGSKGGDDGGDDGGDSGSGSGNSGNTRPTPTSQGGGRPVTTYPSGRFPSNGASLQYPLALIFFFATCLVMVMY